MHSNAPIINIRRATGSPYEGEDPAGAFALLAEGSRRGIAGALITIVGIEGGAPRALGTHMAVLADGTYCGYVSGGCVEAAVAAEAIKVLRAGRDAVLRFGRNSPFIDIQLPCGGGIDLHVHTNPDSELVSSALEAFAKRQPFTLQLSPAAGTANFLPDPEMGATTGWQGDFFRLHHHPATRLVLIGRGLEFETLLKMGHAASLELATFSPDTRAIQLAQQLEAPATPLKGLSDAPDLPIDPWTALVFLFHDHDWETALLIKALASEAFFIGALGSRTTHSARCARLRDRGVAEAFLARIHGPIGLFGPTHNATSLAISVLAQIVEERRTFDHQ